MAHRLRPVRHEFAGNAPVRPVLGREISAAPEAVFPAPAEDVTGWAEWFGAVVLARPGLEPAFHKAMTSLEGRLAA